jgi:hypothetical protein
VGARIVIVGGGVIRSGEIGMLVLQACRDYQLTASEVKMIVEVEKLSALFLLLCHDFLRGSSSAMRTRVRRIQRRAPIRDRSRG